MRLNNGDAADRQLDIGDQATGGGEEGGGGKEESRGVGIEEYRGRTNAVYYPNNYPKDCPKDSGNNQGAPKCF